MNSNYNKSTSSSSSFDFDLGLSSNRNRPLNAQKNNSNNNNFNNNSSNYNSYSSRPQTTPSWQPRASYTHQPAPGQAGLPTGPASMVGDIFGKSWGTSKPDSGIGLLNKNPNLFGDLVGSALGQSKGNSNVPLKNASPVSTQGSKTGSGTSTSTFSMGNMASSLPKTGNLNSGFSGSGNIGSVNYSSGGPSMKNSSGIGSSKDPFGSLVDFGPKQTGSMNSKPASQDDTFGGFQNAPKSDFAGSNTGSYSNFDDFAIPASQNPPPVQSSSGVNVFDSLFTPSSGSVGVSQVADSDWGMDSNDNNNGGTTTEIEGLPPPPAGVSASAAKNKGMDDYKQGQYADAIKWLSWAVVLLEKAGDDVATMEVLSSRASCYKEVGEYKKAVADCTKVLEHDGESVAVLVQRALLYESMEKYKLGANDLRTVMKLDPSNRVARSTIHRLNKMADC